MAFDEVRLPEGIDYGMTGGPEFMTIIQEGYAGHEQRLSSWTVERCSWNITKTLLDQTEIDAIKAFFRARKGKARGFRFKDWIDYQITAGNIGTGNGANRVFQARKQYTSSVTYSRTITKIVSATYSVFVDGVLKVEGANPGGDYTIDVNTGIVTFNTGKAPASSKAVTLTCEFDVPVRFDVDKLDITVTEGNNYEIQNLPIVEIRDIS